jgi:hypothetical protein
MDGKQTTRAEFLWGKHVQNNNLGDVNENVRNARKVNLNMNGTKSAVVGVQFFLCAVFNFLVLIPEK